MALDRNAINKAYQNFRGLSKRERWRITALGDEKFATDSIPGGEYGNWELFFMSPVTVNYSIETFNSFGFAYIKSLAWNLIRNLVGYGIFYFLATVVVIKVMSEYFPEYMPFGMSENVNVMFNGMLGPLFIHAIWATVQRHSTEWKEAKDNFRQKNEYNHAMMEKWNALSDKERAKKMKEV